MTTQSKLKLTTYKLVVLGDAGVGKTSMLQQYANGSFHSVYKATIGADFFSKEICINGKLINLQIWDTAGQERFSSLGTAFYRGSDCCLLVFDITNAASFESVARWRKEFLAQTDVDADKFAFLLLGNKLDNEQQRKVSVRQAEEWCSANGCIPYFEVSALSATNIVRVFRSAAENCLPSASSKDQAMVCEVAKCFPDYNISIVPGDCKSSLGETACGCRTS